MFNTLKILLIAGAAGVMAPVLAHTFLFEPHLTWEQALHRGLELASTMNRPEEALELAKFWLFPGLIVFIGVVGALLRPQTSQFANPMAVCSSCNTKYPLRSSRSCPNCAASETSAA